MTTSRTYTAFGLTIRSDFALEVLDELIPPPAQVDLELIRTPGLIRDQHPPVDPFFDITPDHQYLHWMAIGSFVIDSPARVRVSPHDDVSDHLVSQAFLGLVMSLVLEQRQILCLHAGAVNVAGRAAVLLGDKGAGKSTTSAAMLQQGHLPVTDDLVAVDFDMGADDAPLIRPGFSSMKLWPDSIAALKLDSHSTDRRIHPQTTKLQKRMPVPIPRQNVPFGAAFVLRRSAQAQTHQAHRLPPHEALQMILRYTFMARYGETRLGRAHLVAHMRRCSALVARVPVFELHIRDDLEGLADLADVIAAQTQPGSNT